MNIIIQSLGFKASDALEGFINEKLDTLKSDHIVSANVTLYKGSDANPENNYCEIRLEVPGNDLFVKKHSPHFETSVSECIEVLKQQENKVKSKQQDQLQADAQKVQDALLEGEEDADEDVELEDVVK